MSKRSFPTNFFKDLKVIELANVLAGPSVGLFFAELGAEVIKIENKKTGGDVTRSWKLPTENGSKNTSAYFYSVNFLKKHLFLDLHEKQDYEKCISHIKEADIVIVNFKKGDDIKLKLHYAALKKINPSVIYAGITGFSKEDDRVAYDLILQAETGFMGMNGTPESGPLKMPVALIDLLAAHHLKEAILLALLKREKRKKGSYVSVSLFDAAVTSLANQATNWLVAKHLPQPTGSLHPNIAPYGEIFVTKDKQQVTFAIGSDGQFAKLCKLLKISRVPTDEKYRHNSLRVKNRARLFPILQRKVQKMNVASLQKACIKNQVPFAKIKNLKEVFESPLAQRLIKTVKGENKPVKVVTSIASIIR